MIALAVVAALLLDQLWGEPRRLHPLVGFGLLASRLERYGNRVTHSPWQQRLSGVAALLLLILPLPLLLIWLAQTITDDLLNLLLATLTLYFTIGLKSLKEHATAVAIALEQQQLEAARLAVGRIVSRDTTQLGVEGVSRATVESVLENGSDALFAPLFWFIVVGLWSSDLAAAAALLYRLSNTLDAMWGYRTPRYIYFGWGAARLDDLLNWPSARLTALSYALAGQWRQGLQCWQQQAAHWESPNAGPVMAAGAGALNLQLGGSAVYHGKIENRPPLGLGRAATPDDIYRALALVQRGVGWWLGLLLLATLFA
ncbi:MAG: cobalamin biosynthesis protein [Gammaproteobacteria bacterium]|nr:cobalamin biosynthesis protein [Gammaproteobacteria bacterium]